MADTTIEILGQREVPGLDASNPRALTLVVFYRVAGDPTRGDFVQLPIAQRSDAQIQAAIAAKEKAKVSGPAKRFTIPG